MPARRKSTTSDSTANLGFEATAGRGSACNACEAIPRSPKGNFWLAADSRSAAKGNRANISVYEQGKCAQRRQQANQGNATTYRLNSLPYE